MAGRTLTFRLAGINNENFLMRDEQTGSWWQQASGAAIRGPLAGTKLREVPHEELSFATWIAEQPDARVLRPDAAVLAEENYASARWEEHTALAPVVTPMDPDDPWPPRTIVYGVDLGGFAKAWPRHALDEQVPILDDVGDVPVAVVLSDDGSSVRVFDRRIDGRTLELLALPDTCPIVLIDAETGSTWDFTGTATGGELEGRRLGRIPVLPDYWFDWKTYHPATSTYMLGDP